MKGYPIFLYFQLKVRSISNAFKTKTIWKNTALFIVGTIWINGLPSFKKQSGCISKLEKTGQKAYSCAINLSAVLRRFSLFFLNQISNRQIMTYPQEQVNKRRTFAIISHPDAGKTTITEKCCFTATQFKKPVRWKAKVLRSTRNPTGWKWRNNVGFPLPPLWCNFHITIVWWTCWIPQGMRISLKILTAL